MRVLSCCAGTFATLSRAAAKAAKARLREIGWGRVAPDWPRRAQECERCPLRVIRGGITYCGKPLLEQANRSDPATDGCGCPTIAKAKSPDEHCPLNRAHRPAMRARDGACTCKWCNLPSGSSP
jgi:hypothetical protein